MAKADGFLLYDRAMPPKESVEHRVQHYNEFLELPDDKTIHAQAARCMDCGVPFCMSGCPLGNIIPEFNDAAYQKKWQKAYFILKSTNIFPEFTGRICPAPCESSCVLGINQNPVNIEEIEKNIAEMAYNEGWVTPHIPQRRTDKKIAIIGSGPAGLAAADELNQKGFHVTVFERQEKIGGLLRYGIPDFKLGKNVIDRRLEIMEMEGIEFLTNKEVGKDISTEEMMQNYDALVLAVGSTVPRDLPIKNRTAKGIYFAMDYLKQSNQYVSDHTPLQLDAKDKKVIVIGGGDTGSDCIGTANRQGAKSITQLEILPKPPAQRDETMPWPQYPMVYKTTSSHEEGCERLWAINAKEFISDDKGQLTGIKVVELEWTKDPNTKRYHSFIEKPGTETVIPCDFVFLAMGFLHVEHSPLLDQLGIHFDPKGNIVANDSEYKTNKPNIFSCGDARRGQSLVVWAIKEGRDCAQKVQEFFSNQ